MSKLASTIAWSISCVLASLWLSSANVFATQVASANEDGDTFLWFDNPSSVVDRLEERKERKDHLFQFPGVNDALRPWYDLKANLDDQHGFKFGISYTALYQNASNTFGPEDDAAGFDLDISGTWMFLGRGTASPAILGFQLFWRGDLGTELTPQTLFTQFGSLYSSGAPYGETGPTIGQLWLQKKFGDTFGVRVGQVFPITAYDFFPFKNFRTDFVDFNHATNAAIPLPDYGLGAFMRYKPAPNIRFTVGLHDANADAERAGFDTYDGELFKYFEVAFDIGLEPRVARRPPSGYVLVSLWHQDEREDAGIDDGWGIGLSAGQRLGRFTPFARLGYADVNAQGPTSVRLMANIGLVVDEIFGQTNDRVGVGYTWSDPANRSLNDQHTIDAYYRVQLTPEIQIGPTLELIFDPVSNPNEDTIFVGGIRARIAF